MTADDAADDFAFAELWRRLPRPFDVIHTVSAVTGLSPITVSHLVGLIIAASPETKRLLDSMPWTIRSLATSIQTNAERCIGQLRGPVLWSETMSARASSFGDPDLFVCSTPSRAYDISENQVLAFALAEVVRSGQLAADRADAIGTDDPQIGDALRAAFEAGRFLDHPSLRDVSRKRPGARAIKRTRSGKHRATYAPALAVLEKVADPLTHKDLKMLCDARTIAQVRTLIAIMQRLERDGRKLPEIRVERGALYTGPIQYYHSPKDDSRNVLSGIVIGQLLVDVPYDLEETDRDRAEEMLRTRSRRRHTMVVMTDDDVDRAIKSAIDLATGAATSS